MGKKKNKNKLSYREIENLMKPSDYSGSVKKKNGATIQPHRNVAK